MPRRLFRELGEDVKDDLGGFFHTFEGNPFELAVEIEAAGEDVRTRQAAETEVRTVGAAADRLHFGLHACVFNGLFGYFDDTVVRFHLLTHVIVLVLEDEFHRAGAVFGVNEIGHPGHHFLARLELGAVVIADDVGEIGLLDRSLERNQMEEAFVAFGIFGTGHHRQHGIQFLADEDGVAHLAFGVARMHVAALDVQFCRGGVEVLEFELPCLAAVHGVGVFGVEAGHVELDHTAAYLFVGGETDAHGAVLELGMGHDILHRVHDFRHACLVVGSEKGGAVGGDYGFALMGQQFGEFGGFEHQAGNALQRDVGTVVVLYDLRLDVLAGSVGRGVHVGDEADCGHFGGAGREVARDAAHHVAVFVEGGLDAKVIQLLAEKLQQV